VWQSEVVAVAMGDVISMQVTGRVGRGLKEFTGIAVGEGLVKVGEDERFRDLFLLLLGLRLARHQTQAPLHRACCTENDAIVGTAKTVAFLWQTRHSQAW